MGSSLGSVALNLKVTACGKVIAVLVPAETQPTVQARHASAIEQSFLKSLF